MKRDSRPGGFFSECRIAIRDAAIVAAVCTLVASGVNLVRGDGIPFVQREDYQILVPCPETAGEVMPISPADTLLPNSRTLVIDARSAAEFGEWHYRSSWNVPYDYLEPTPAETIRRIASSGARRVFVYGDGKDPDCGHELAREIAGKGIRNVGFIEGGAPVLRKAGLEETGK